MKIEIERHYPIQIGAPDHVSLVLVGCGGTGSFLALHLARLARHAQERHNLEIHLTFVDPDHVEAKNLARQNFCQAELGAAKAEALALRYSAAFGLPIYYHVERFSSDYLPWTRGDGRGQVRVIVGAVDNAAARQAIHKAVAGSGIRSRTQWTSYGAPEGHFWWLDCGNHEFAGQVLIGNRADLTAPEISPLGFCGGLPLPTVQAPDLLDPEPVMEVPAASCAELVLRDAQSLMVNQMVAAYAAEYVNRLLIARDLDRMATYFDLKTLGARSTPITAARTEQAAA